MSAAELGAAALRAWPLPPADAAGKAARGTCLVVGGSALTPGAVVLAALGALRAGAGKVQVATVASAAAHLAVAVPELLVTGLDEDEGGHLTRAAGARLEGQLRRATSVLVGPGLLDEAAAHELLGELARRLPDDAVLAVDAKALSGLADDPSPLRALAGRAVLTPNLDEAAALLGGDDLDDGVAAHAAAELCARFAAVVAVRGPSAHLAAPDGRRWRCGPLVPGLACPGSGDVAAGLVGGLAARCTDPAHAACWAIAAHAEAGQRAALDVGDVGFLAREVVDRVPAALRALAS